VRREAPDRPSPLEDVPEDADRPLSVCYPECRGRFERVSEPPKEGDMKKRVYRKTRIEDVQLEGVSTALSGPRIVFAVDVAKEKMVGVLVDAGTGAAVTIAWRNPVQNGAVAELLGELRRLGRSVEVVMEASGSYGDVLRYRLGQEGYPVYRVSGKRAHDLAEVHDGVPSLHDAKSAAIIAKLHLDGASAPWPDTPVAEKRMKATLSTMEMYHDHHLRLIHQLEGWLARHWPEVTGLLELTAATLLALLGRIGGPKEVAERPEAVRELLHGLGHGLVGAEKIAAVIESARTTAGVPMDDAELAALQALASEAHRALKQFKNIKSRVEALSTEGAANEMAPVTGKATAVVLIADAGDPREYPAARAYLKALGLNLKEKSSGTIKGSVTITKRGPSRARQWLWLAVLRWVQKDENAAAWYRAKVARDGGKKVKAIVALMRKLARALFHVARGEAFDSGKLFGHAPVSTSA